jgi:ABC-type phosphate transport system ATPase subunit
LQTYTNNISDIRDIESKVKYLEGLSTQLTETQVALNKSIDEINTLFPEKEGYSKVPELIFKNHLEALSENKKNVLELKDEKGKQNQAIKSDFEKEGFTGDLSSLLENAETYQSQIKWADKQLDLISKKEKALKKAIKDRNALGVKIKTEYERQKIEIDTAWSSILDKHGGKNKELIEKILLKEGKIVVSGEIAFDEQIFYHNLHELVDRRTFRDIQALKTKFKISTFEELIDFVSTGLNGFLDGESSDRFVGIKTLFFGLKERSEYLRTVPKITYDGKGLDRLSVGQRGTVYLCLKLATDAFSKPIIFDQPEDDLDNEFIMNELIDIFKELKKYRQIVIVSHNANLVVNADAEQVIIAYNKEEKLSYKSGALEDPFIIDSACNVLEGGKDAFEKRKNKYSFK